MIIIDSITEMRAYSQLAKQRGEQIGLVPTMGFLHQGHGSLISTARLDNPQVVVSIFVNPLQFGPNEDLERYPRDLLHDRDFCQTLGVDVLFTPTVTEMYGPDGALTRIHVDKLGDHLCGASRPGHFDGVATVVAKLFSIINPERAYFGKKDFQQISIVKRMVRDLSLPVAIMGVDTVREADGLAKSSRNVYLSEQNRLVAPELYKSLQRIQWAVANGEHNLDHLLHIERATIEQFSDIRIDYLTCVDPDLLQPITMLHTGTTCVCAVAAFVGNTRLIDNIVLNSPN